MNDENVGGVHWSFWLISVVALIFNAMGVINYFMQMNADSLASFPEVYRPIIEGRPAWATSAFAIAVFGGSLGCLLLLLRKSAAFYVLIASLLGVIVSMMHIFGVAGLSSFEVWIGVLMQLVVTAFLIWYSKLAKRKGWTR
jgi:amino acid transporter